MSGRGRLRSRVICGITGLFLVWATMVYGRILHLGWSEFSAGKAALSARDPRGAVIHFDRALQLYLPWGGASDPAAKELLRIAEEFEARGEKRSALETYRTVRGGLYGARSFYTPHREWISLCDEKIARLMSKLPPETEKEKGQTEEERYHDALALMAPPTRPRLTGSLAAVVGLLGWVGGTLGLIWSGLDRRSGMGRRLLFWGGITLIFYLCWVLGLARA
jgi:hypothetical protein